MRIHWDEPLEKEVAKEWQASVKGYQTSRRYFTTAFTTSNMVLHVFAETSTKA